METPGEAASTIICADAVSPEGQLSKLNRRRCKRLSTESILNANCALVEHFETYNNMNSSAATPEIEAAQREDGSSALEGPELDEGLLPQDAAAAPEFELPQSETCLSGVAPTTDYDAPISEHVGSGSSRSVTEIENGPTEDRRLVTRRRSLDLCSQEDEDEDVVCVTPRLHGSLDHPSARYPYLGRIVGTPMAPASDLSSSISYPGSEVVDLEDDEVSLRLREEFERSEASHPEADDELEFIGSAGTGTTIPPILSGSRVGGNFTATAAGQSYWRNLLEDVISRSSSLDSYSRLARQFLKPLMPSVVKTSEQAIIHPDDPSVLVDALMAKLTCPICYRGFRRKKGMRELAIKLQQRRLEIDSMDLETLRSVKKEIEKAEQKLNGLPPAVSNSSHSEAPSGVSQNGRIFSPKSRKRRRLCHDDDAGPLDHPRALHNKHSQSPGDSRTTREEKEKTSASFTGIDARELEKLNQENKEDCQSSPSDSEHETTVIRVGRCGHVYCEKCIKKYVMLKKKCPVCNQSLTVRQLFPLYL